MSLIKKYNETKKLLQNSYTNDDRCNFSRILGHENMETFAHFYWNLNS